MKKRVPKPYHGNPISGALDNDAFRRVVYTTPDLKKGEGRIQLVYMSLIPDEDIGMESHNDTTQVITVASGIALAIINGKKKALYPGDTIIVPATAIHNVINAGEKDLKLYTLYTPPHHPSRQ